mmetsp:Transcript_39026/g.76770  ORF Transcript_39026/g.76770 Transcript_39026/m.76770 type:complete len:86 (-) Transcript_39026:617-874(-)
MPYLPPHFSGKGRRTDCLLERIKQGQKETTSRWMQQKNITHSTVRGRGGVKEELGKIQGRDIVDSQRILQNTQFTKVQLTDSHPT